MARKRARTFGNAGVDEAGAIDVVWEQVERRETQDERDEWRAKRELGVPTEQLWSEMGYSLAEIERMRQSPEYQARLAMMQVGLDGAAG